MSFDNLEFTKWNGIDYKNSGYTSKSMFFENVYEEEKEIFEFEKMVFDGYQNNSIVFPNILNLSFLFDKYEKEFKDPLLYKNFAMNLKSNRKIITSDEFANQTAVYAFRYLGYHGILKEVKQKNESLIQLIEAQLKH
jgi:hypothetical protein